MTVVGAGRGCSWPSRSGLKVILLVACLAVSLTAGCAGWDPTDDSQFSWITFVNDTNTKYTLLT